MTHRILWLLAILILAYPGIDARAGGKTLPPVADPLVANLCGECHMAFPPGFLPARSWTAIMATLDDHFGEDATRPGDQARAVEAYLTDHAGDAPGGGGLREFMRWVAPGGVPRRITDNPAFLREHDFPERVWQRPEVVTRSNCPACHRRADRGLFDD